MKKTLKPLPSWFQGGGPHGITLGRNVALALGLSPEREETGQVRIFAGHEPAGTGAVNARNSGRLSNVDMLFERLDVHADAMLPLEVSVERDDLGKKLVFTVARSGTTRRYWALFANPETYRIDEAVVELAEDLWVTAGRPIRSGDRLLIWRGRGRGSSRGVVALGKVIAEPQAVSDASNPYWVVAPSSADTKLRVRVRYIVTPRLPLRLDEHDDVLGQLSVSRAKGGTVFNVTEDQWNAVVELAGGWPEAATTKPPGDGGVSLSIAEKLHAAIENGGDEIHLANAESGWFAVAPRKWEELVDRARREGRDGPNLVVYRTRTDDPRDHYVIPFAVVGAFLADTPTTPKKGGQPRWELSLRGGRLMASRPPREISVSGFYGGPLPCEEALVLPDVAAPTADLDELDRRVARLRKLPISRPTGNPTPRRVTTSQGVAYERRADVKAWVLRAAEGHCELCGSAAPFIGDDGEPYLEVHHVEQLAHGGPDTVENAVALCPNCHRRLHHCGDREADRQRLYAQVGRLTKADEHPPT